ncbi:MAG: OsmC family protein [Desulfarculaceae bacterium]|nr:OsmC family protein [Desulfarculaceae bacterium]
MQISTDQSKEEGGDASAPEPFALFLASLGTCAGVYALSFCRARQIPTDGMKIKQTNYFETEPQMKLVRVELALELPEGFPAKYEKAVTRAMDLCAVKKTIFNPPEIEITAARS